MTTVYVADITAWNGSSTVVLRFATKGFSTAAGDTPAHTPYFERLQQPVIMSRTAFGDRTTMGQSQVSVGDLVLTNADGMLDQYRSYAFDGRSLVIRRGVAGAAYPSGYTTLFAGTMDRAIFAESTVTIDITDAQQYASVPFQTLTFAGTNTPPTGLEGSPNDLMGKVKPVLLGTAFNFSPNCVNPYKLIYQVSDGPIHSIDGVRDKGTMITAGTSSWTDRTAGFSTTTIFGVAYGVVSGVGTWVAVGDTGKITSSTDGGLTWTSRTSGFGTNKIGGVTFGGGLFVAVGVSAGNGAVSTSPDGITWTLRTNAFGWGAMTAVAFGNGAYVAVGQNGSAGRSTNGTVWADITVSSGLVGIVQPTSIAYGFGNTWAICGSLVGGATCQIAVSTDNGLTFPQTATYNAANSAAYNGITYGNAGFVIVGDTGNILTSPTGAAWTFVVNNTVTALSGFGSANLTSICYGNGLYLATAAAGVIGESQDGASWAIDTLTDGSHADTCCGYGDGSYVVAGGTGLLRTPTGITVYASLTDLQDDAQAPPNGGYGVYLGGAGGGSFFRLGSSPNGTVTCDASQGANAAARTLAQLAVQVFGRAGLTSGAWSASDVTALDIAQPAVMRLYIDSDTTCADVLNQLTQGAGVSIYADAMGVLRLKQLVAPSGSPVATIVANQIDGALTQVISDDVASGIPRARTVIRYQKNYTVQTTDLDGGVSDADRSVYGNEWRDAGTTLDTSVLAAHPLAPTVTIESCFASATDAQAEATRQQALFGVQRDWFQCPVFIDDTTAAIDLFDVVNVIHPRYGLSGGKLFVPLGVAPDVKGGTTTLTMWGVHP